MNALETLEVPLPAEMVTAVRARVVSGEYATESDVILAGLRMLLARDRAVDDWLRTVAAPALDGLQEDPGRALQGAAVKARLSRQRR